jgi:exonuclease SbcD
LPHFQPIADRMKFIHAADIHLDSPLVGLSAYQDAPADVLRLATRQAFENLVSEAIAEAVDFMVIAGDLYDGPWRDFNTGLYFVRQMGRLKAAGIPVYLLMGNHDAENDMTRRLVLPDNVHKFAANKAQTYKIDALRVALHGRSFKDAATTDNLAVHYPAALDGWFNIGVLHTALEGNSAHANYAPCSIAELQAKGYQYWALGHVHEHRIIDGPCTIAFPGNLQGRHIRETGARGALLVQADGTQTTSVERLLVDVLRWQHLQVDVTGAATLQDAVVAVGRAMAALLDAPDSDRPCALRVSLHGSCAAHGELFGQEQQLREEVKAQALALDSARLWIEKVRLETTAPLDAAAIAARSDAVADLQQLLSGAGSDAALLEALQADLQPLLNKLPKEVLAAAPQLEALRAGDVAALLEAATPALLEQVAKAH